MRGMTVYLIANPKKPQSHAVAARAAQILSQSGADVVCCSEEVCEESGGTAELVTEKAALEHSDIIVTVGGDGTILHAARRSLGRGIPLVGVNLGRMGFLATVESYELDKLRRLPAGDYTLDRRNMLRAELHGKNARCHTALNDLVIAKRAVSQTIEISVYCDGIPVNRYQGDGVILATPTGSTAYSLSAGGPILDARIAGIVMTPICAHSMRSPAMVFSAGRKLRVQIHAPEQEAAVMSCDGCSEENLFTGDVIDVALSDQTIELVCFNEADQFEAIDKKLKGR